ncbi:MAG: hypothetical protein H7A46_18680 [Verrucomicrobiales bacterium]|nr:hypothetical protein [Verrucomicrobiales bacterium]
MSTRALAGLLFASLVANIVLVVTLVLAWEPGRPMEVTLVRPATVTNIYRPVRTNIVVEARPLRWHDLESTNYAFYISNLRSIGCPEATVRDIITAEIDDLFAGRRRRELVLPRHQWWRSKPDPALVAAAGSVEQSLADERAALLTRLLGSAGSETGTARDEAEAATPLDGPVLGALAEPIRAAVRSAEQLRDRRLQELAQAGEALSPAEAVRLDGMVRTNLAAVLNPEQLEEYLLRYSRTANELRDRTSELDLGPEEFRALFRALDPLEQRLSTLGGGTETAEAAAEQVDLLARREAVLQETLSPEQYAEYSLNQNPAYTSQRDRLRELGLPERHALPLYEINQVTREEIARLQSDSGLDAAELAAQLEAVEHQRQAAVQTVLGPEGFAAYQASRVP